MSFKANDNKVKSLNMSRLFSKLLHVCVVLLYSLTIYGQDKISKQQALDDIQYLIKTSYDIHPDFYRSKDSIEFENEIMQLSTENDSIYVNSFQVHLRRNLNKIRDGHTFVYFKNYDSIVNGKIRYPIKIIKGELFLLKNKNNSFKIQSINNISSSKIYKELTELVSGEFLDYKEYILEQNFLFFFQILYGKTTCLNIKHNDNQEKCKVLKTMKNITSKYSFYLINDTTAILKLSSFAFNNNTGNTYKQFVDSVFNVIEHDNKISNLFIDLSENTGGNSAYGDYVLNYLTEKPYKAYNYLKLKRSKTSKKYFKDKFIKWYLYPIAIFSRQARLVALKKVGKETLLLKSISPKNKGYIYRGKIYLITSAKTYSAGATMAVSFRNALIGKIIGQPSGQPIRGFIDLITYKLPNSQIQIATSFKEYEYINDRINSEKIEPDIYIKTVIGENIGSYYTRIIEKIREER